MQPKETIKHTAYVAGTGIITAIGNDTPTCFASLLAGKSGIGRIEYMPTHWQDEIPVAEVKATRQELAAITGANPGWPRTALLSAVAVQEAWQPFRDKAKGLRTGFLSANTVGGMDLTETVYESFIQDNDSTDFINIAHHECGAITEIVARHFGIHDFTTTVSTACSSSANSIMMAAQMIQSGMLDIAIAGGADSLSRFTLNGFNTLMILDRKPCRPFDETRNGLNLGEGAGYIVLMNDKALAQCNAEAICKVSGYANTNDAFHQTASSPEGRGNKMAMEVAMQVAGLSPADIDYINLHGTGTANNDSSEGKAVEAVFGNNVPGASSTKTYTGHTLGASGGVEAVFSVLSIKEGVVFPNLRWEQPMQDINWTPVALLQTGLDIRHVLSNSFGFGGNCSSLVFSAC